MISKFLGMTRITSKEDMPSGPHYVLMEFSSYTPYTGWEDEGGVSGSNFLPEIWVTTDKEMLEDAIKLKEFERKQLKQYHPYNDYVAYHVDVVAVVETQIKIDV